MVDPLSTSPNVNALYGPALRIVFYQGLVKDELVFEQAYQAGGYSSAAAQGTWNVTNTNSTFYLKSNGHENTQMTMADWVSSKGFGDAKVGGIYVGVGSGVGPDVFVHYDNIIAGGTEYKFDLSAASGAVPEPASWALMICGFGFVGASMRRRSSVVTA
ncbi:PEPxxWA-CTERM sorting domain-containing protein (plasmid) [Polymorphobacter sp. PAMC 29334]|nr:PEPxxWA-CTERM sorting domain-containing protein [Polymorphobacter sp. PAMC 29334]